MIEEIKKEIHDEVIFNNIANEHKGYIKEKKVFEILDKYKDKEIKFEDGSSKYGTVKVPELKIENIKNYNQPDYKSAWEELKNKTNEELKQATWAGAGLNDTKISMQELEKKYNIGDKNE